MTGAPARTRSIALLATGGTIAATPPTPQGQCHGGVETLVPAAHGLPVDVVGRTLLTRSSRAMTLVDLLALAAAVRAEIRAGRSGVVVTHGTDTLEETVYALALLVEPRVPVVVTGAMRAAHLDGNDGPANVRAAAVAAADPELAAYGPVVVAHDEVHVARLVAKMHSARVAAFASPAAGPVGAVVEDRLELLLGPPPHADHLGDGAAAIPSDGSRLPRVGLLAAATEVDGAAARAMAAECPGGLVVAALGGGHVSPDLGATLVELARGGLPVVVASRCPDGTLLRHSYAGAGSETALRASGVHFAGALAAPKARLRLAFGLAVGLAPGELFPT